MAGIFLGVGGGGGGIFVDDMIRGKKIVVGSSLYHIPRARMASSFQSGAMY